MTPSKGALLILLSFNFAAPVSSQGYRCAAGWVLNRDISRRCFHEAVDAKLFTAAKRSCEQMQANLASISSQAEMNWITSTFTSQQRYWVGLWKETPSAGATSNWLDSNPTSYRGWAPGQPDEASQSVLLNVASKALTDEPDTATSAYLCSKAAVLVQPKTEVKDRCRRWRYRLKNKRKCGFQKVKKNRSKFVPKRQSRQLQKRLLAVRQRERRLRLLRNNRRSRN